MVTALLGVAALLGFLLGAVILPRRTEGSLPPAQLGPLSFPITPVTMTVYGVVIVGAGVLCLVLAVRVVSARYAEE